MQVEKVYISDQGVFPDPQMIMIQIANMITIQGSSTPIIKNVFTLGTCANIAGPETNTFLSLHQSVLLLRLLILGITIMRHNIQ